MSARLEKETDTPPAAGKERNGSKPPHWVSKKEMTGKDGPSARPLRTLLRQLFDLEREVFFRQAHDGASFLIPCLAVTL